MTSPNAKRRRTADNPSTDAVEADSVNSVDSHDLTANAAINSSSSSHRLPNPHPANPSSSDIPPPATYIDTMASSLPQPSVAELDGTVPHFATSAELDALCRQLKLTPPPRAGLVHPEGYQTNPPPTGRPVRIYADGVFDLFHLGHMRQLQQAKQAFPQVYLIVGVTGDEETLRRKGLTVLPAKDRAETVRHCRWVDEVVEDCPWIIADHPEFIEKHQIDYIAHDDIPYGADEGDDIYGPIKASGKFLVTQRTEGVSTTGIITKIVRDYELYIMRQLKRGTTRKELNISWLKKNEMDIKRTIAELRDNVWHNWSTTGQELSRDLRHLLQPLSRPPSPSRRSTVPSHDDHDASNGPSPSGHLQPPNPLMGEHRAGSPNPTVLDFASGYALGLVSGVRSWVTKSRRPSGMNSRASSPASDSNDETHTGVRHETRDVPMAEADTGLPEPSARIP